jgi:hypothetical protein
MSDEVADPTAGRKLITSGNHTMKAPLRIARVKIGALVPRGLLGNTKNCETLVTKVKSFKQRPDKDTLASLHYGEPPTCSTCHPLTPSRFLTFYRNFCWHLYFPFLLGYEVKP